MTVWDKNLKVHSKNYFNSRDVLLIVDDTHEQVIFDIEASEQRYYLFSALQVMRLINKPDRYWLEDRMAWWLP